MNALATSASQTFTRFTRVKRKRKVRKVVVFYKDPAYSLRDEYMVGPYPGDRIEDVKRNLRAMGCEDFRTEPYKEVA